MPPQTAAHRADVAARLKIGRPRRYHDPDTLQTACDRYFASTHNPTIIGLAIALGFTSRQALLNYEGYEDAGPLIDVLKTARMRCEEHLGNLLTTPKLGVHPAGPIFLLKNSHGYKDVQEIISEKRELTMGVTVSIEAHAQELADVQARIQGLLTPQNHLPEVSGLVGNAPENADRPALETADRTGQRNPAYATPDGRKPVIGGTFASQPSTTYSEAKVDKSLPPQAKVQAVGQAAPRPRRARTRRADRPGAPPALAEAPSEQPYSKSRKGDVT